MTGLTASSMAGNQLESKLIIIFSSREGFAWASWPETEASVRLGRHDMVTRMMQDFLAQDDLAKKLNRARTVE
jgi:hypothetical protein